MIVANKVGEDGGRTLGFGADDNQVIVLWADSKQDFPLISKTVLARELIELIADRFEMKNAVSKGRNASA